MSIFPKEVNLTDIAQLTGKHHSTIRTRLETIEPLRRDKTGEWYPLQEALALVYKTNYQPNLELAKERARLAQKQADKIELEIKKMQGSLIDAEVWCEEWARLFVAFRDAMRTMAMQLATTVTQCQDVDQNYQAITKYTDEALEEIANIAQKELDKL